MGLHFTPSVTENYFNFNHLATEKFEDIPKQKEQFLKSSLYSPLNFNNYQLKAIFFHFHPQKPLSPISKLYPYVFKLNNQTSGINERELIEFAIPNE